MRPETVIEGEFAFAQIWIGDKFVTLMEAVEEAGLTILHLHAAAGT